MLSESSENGERPSLGGEDKLKIDKVSKIFKDEICEQPYAPISFIVFLYLHPDAMRFQKCYFA
jgi:hypothetical protein